MNQLLLHLIQSLYIRFWIALELTPCGSYSYVAPEIVLQSLYIRFWICPGVDFCSTPCGSYSYGAPEISSFTTPILQPTIG